MNGAVTRQGMIPQTHNGINANNMLAAIGNPPFPVQNPQHMGQTMTGGPQNMNNVNLATNPPMGMLTGAAGGPQQPGPHNRGLNYMQQHQQQQQQRNPMVPQFSRQGSNLPPGANTNAAVMQAQLQHIQFPMMGQTPGPSGGGPGIPGPGQNGALRRVPSQPHLNAMGGMPSGVGGPADMGMSMRPGQHPNSQAAAAAQQQQQQHQRIIQQQQHNIAMRNNLPNQGLPPPMARTPSQVGVGGVGGPVMNSLSPVTSIPPHPGSGMQHPPPHQQHPHPQNLFNNPNGIVGGPNMPSHSQHQHQHPPQLSSSPRPTQIHHNLSHSHTPNMSMGTPGPSHTPVNVNVNRQQRSTPDNTNMAPFMGGYPGSQFSSSATATRVASVSTPAGFPPYGPSSSAPPMGMDISQPSPPTGGMVPGGGNSGGGTPNRTGFNAMTSPPNHAYGEIMNNNPSHNGPGPSMDGMFPPNFGMPPPSNVPPPRPPSHATNPHNSNNGNPSPHHPPTPGPQQSHQGLHPSPAQQQAQQQQQQGQSAHHASPPGLQGDQSNQPQMPGMNNPLRPQSAQAHQPGRPPSQTTIRTPRTMQMQLPGGNMNSVISSNIPLTAAGRIPNPVLQQPPQGGLGGAGASMQPIAPRPPPLPGVGGSTVPNGPSTAQTTTTQIASLEGIPSLPPAGTVPVVGPRPPMQPVNPVSLGQGILRLVQFSGVLSSETKTKTQLSWWSELIKEYFTPKAIMKLTLWRDNQRQEAKPFEIGVPILPRFFLVTTQSGVKSMTLSLDGARERSFRHGEPHHTIVECVSAVWTYKYTNGYTVTLKGPLTVHVLVVITVPATAGQPPQYTLKFDDFQFDANFHDKYIALDAISGNRVPESPVSWKQFAADDETELPRINGFAPVYMLNDVEDEKLWEEPRTNIENASIPGEPVNAFGIPQATMRCLELAESVTSMTDLIVFATETDLGPKDALARYAAKIRENSLPLAEAALAQRQAAAANALPQSLSSQAHNSNNNSNTNSATSNNNPSLSSPFPISQSIGPSPSGTLYSSAPASITNPQSTNPPSSMNSPQNTSSSTNSPEKQLKTIPQQQQGQTPSQSGGPASSPAVSSGGTTNTPSLANASLKRKQTSGEASSPTVGNAEQPSKRVSRKRMRAGTTGGAG